MKLPGVHKSIPWVWAPQQKTKTPGVHRSVNAALQECVRYVLTKRGESRFVVLPILPAYEDSGVQHLHVSGLVAFIENDDAGGVAKIGYRQRHIHWLGALRDWRGSTGENPAIV